MTTLISRESTTLETYRLLITGLSVRFLHGACCGKLNILNELRSIERPTIVEPVFRFLPISCLAFGFSRRFLRVCPAR
jgi:hypothetical protein